MTSCFLAAACAVVLIPAALAQEEHGACRADVQKFCKDVQPGGGRIGRCLKQNEAALSRDCRDRMDEGRRKMEDVAEACRADAKQFCGDIAPGHGRVMRCLSDNRDRLSAPCRAKIDEAHARHPCAQDAGRLCADVRPGKGRVARCLKQKEADLSAECRAHLQRHPRSEPGGDGQ